MNNNKIFFSYSRVDGATFAWKLATDLKAAGYDVWIDQEDIRAGTEWDKEIEKALETSDCLLFIETEASVNSVNVLDEVYYALEQKKRVIPLVVIDSKTPYRLQRIQHISFVSNYKAGLAQLLESLSQKEIKTNYVSGEVSTHEQKGKKRNNKLLVAVFTFFLLLTSAIIVLLNRTNKDGDKPVVPASTVAATDSTRPLQATKPMAVVPESIATTPAQTTLATTEQTTTTNTNTKVKPAIKKNMVPAIKINTAVPVAAASNVEELIGQWVLADVKPASRSFDGYLNLTTDANNKLTIKSAIKFYYHKTNKENYLTVFNAFLSCDNCAFQKTIKLQADDVALGSQYFNILKEDIEGVGKKGDTTSDYGSNKSIGAIVLLNFPDKKTAMVTIRRPDPVELNNGLLIRSFEYSFKFKKSSY